MNYLLFYKDYIKDLLFISSTPPPQILTIDETIDAIIKNKLSVSRFGDGELSMLITHHDIGFQKSNNLLSQRLSETLNSTNQNLLICIPKVFEKKDIANLNKDAYKFWHRYVIKNRQKLYKIFNFNKIYGNTEFTRNYIDLNSKIKSNSMLQTYFDHVKKIWYKRNIIIIEGRYTRFGVGNDLLNNALSTKRIICPEKNAFDKYQQIFTEALKQDKTSLFLIALGPTATVLASDLCNNGFQAIDIGHLDIEYEWFLMGAKEKTAVKNKYVNEGDHVITEKNDTLNNIEYQKQIISQIL